MPGYYNLAEWLKARRQALHDAGYRCQRCGTSLLNKGREAHVHHRKPLKAAPALRCEPLNLLALCRACHTAVHEQEKRPTMCNEDGSPSDPDHPWFDDSMQNDRNDRDGVRGGGLELLTPARRERRAQSF
jgi:HNH endonuclease